jgi:hypothetical protein
MSLLVSNICELITTSNQKTLFVKKHYDYFVGILDHHLIDNISFVVHNLKESSTIPGVIRVIDHNGEKLKVWCLTEEPLPLFYLFNYTHNKVRLDAQITFKTTRNVFIEVQGVYSNNSPSLPNISKFEMDTLDGSSKLEFIGKLWRVTKIGRSKGN